MKGVIFNLFAEVVADEYGEEHLEQLYESADVSGAYTSLGNYPDAELFALIGAHAQAAGAELPEVLRWFGRRSMPRLAERYAVLFAGHRTTRDFLLTLNSIIHAEVRKLYPGAAPPDFGIETGAEASSLTLTYRSARRLCPLAEGFIEGAAAHYGEQVEIEQTRCLGRGDEACEIQLGFRSANGPADAGAGSDARVPAPNTVPSQRVAPASGTAVS